MFSAFRSTAVSILVANLCLVYAQTVSADPDRRELPRLAYLVAGGDEAQALNLVIVKHRYTRQPQAAECSFSGELRMVDLTDGEAEVEAHAVMLDENTRSVVRTYRFESGRNNMVVELFGETSSSSCRVTLTPTLVNPTLGTTVGAVRCCGEACDCPPPGRVEIHGTATYGDAGES